MLAHSMTLKHAAKKVTEASEGFKENHWTQIKALQKRSENLMSLAHWGLETVKILPVFVSTLFLVFL